MSTDSKDSDTRVEDFVMDSMTKIPPPETVRYPGFLHTGFRFKRELLEWSRYLRPFPTPVYSKDEKSQSLNVTHCDEKESSSPRGVILEGWIEDDMLL